MADSPASQVTFPDVESLQDLATFVRRARAIDDDGAIRLQSTGTALAAWVCVLPGRGVLGEGVVLGMRAMPLASSQTGGPTGGESDHPRFDTTYALAGLADRFARRDSTGDCGTSLPLPPNPTMVAWAALSPARSGWEAGGSVSAETLQAAARQGISDVAQGTPDVAGAAAVTALRARVWSVPVAVDGESSGPNASALAEHDSAGAARSLTAGSAFAAYSLGFLRPGERATVHRAGPWTRLTLAAGHVLSR